MKFSLFIGAVVAQQPSLPPGITPPPGFLPESSPAPIPTQPPPPKDFDGARCPTQKWNENILGRFRLKSPFNRYLTTW